MTEREIERFVHRKVSRLRRIGELKKPSRAGGDGRRTNGNPRWKKTSTERTVST